MNIFNIILGVIAFLIIYYIFKFMTVKSTLTNTNDAKDKIEISKDKLEKDENSPASNFTYSIWFYVDHWNYRYGQPKIVFGRINSDKEPQPSVTLGATRNDLTISLACYPGEDNSASKSVVHNCKLQNIPIQKWNHLLFSVYGKSMDVYLDGKLARTCVLPGTAKVTESSNIYVTPAGGFSGQTAKMQYFDSATNPQQAYNIYRAGFGQFSLLDKFKIMISLYTDGEETGTITI